MRLAVPDEELVEELELDELSWCWLPFALVVEIVRLAPLATKRRDSETRGRQWDKRGVGRNPRGIENAARMMLRELYL